MQVIATAGHVDHGKSTLVRRLTGMEPDRWAEERRRGMTIDLGYAWTTLDDGSQIVFVDVPGHQRFISNMLAGIGPVGAVLLVVAADEGWSRQTTEHVVALDALGVTHGVLAISRSDLGDPMLAAEEAHDHLAGTSLAGSETVLVSGLTGAGLPELRAALGRLARSLPAARREQPRLWVDRVFTVRGSGTVVTGTLASGRLAVGDDLLLAPGGEKVVVRSLQTLKTPVDEATAVARVAVNLRRTKATQVRRGHALVAPGQWAQVGLVDVRLVRVPERVPAQLVLHIGSAAVPVRLRRFTAELARLTLDTALPLHVGERGLLRDPGAQRIAGGFVVLDTAPPALRRRGAAAARAAELADVTGRPDPSGEVQRRGIVRHEQLVQAGVLGARDPLPAGAVAAGRWLVSQQRWRELHDRLGREVAAWAASNPMSPGMPRAAVVRALDLPDPKILEALLAESPEVTSDSVGVHPEGVQHRFPTEVERALDELSERLGSDPFAAPSVPELDEQGLTDQHLAAAVKAGRFIRVADGVYLRAEAPDEAVARLATLHQPFTLAEAREVLGAPRRVMLPLLEFLDRRGDTQRVDTDHRRVRRRPD